MKNPIQSASQQEPLLPEEKAPTRFQTFCRNTKEKWRVAKMGLYGKCRGKGKLDDQFEAMSKEDAANSEAAKPKASL